MRVLWERIVIAVHELYTMREEVHRKDRLGHCGFLYRFAVGACRSRLADYLSLEHDGTGRVLILKVAA
jgi:hypothetical protein